MTKPFSHKNSACFDGKVILKADTLQDNLKSTNWKFQSIFFKYSEIPVIPLYFFINTRKTLSNHMFVQFSSLLEKDKQHNDNKMIQYLHCSVQFISSCKTKI